MSTRMFSSFRSPWVWGRRAAQLRREFHGDALIGLVRPDAGVESVVVRPCLGRDHYRVEAVRRENQEWLRPWEATLPPESGELLPTWPQYTRRLDRQMKASQGLTMLIEVNGGVAGQVSVGAVEHGAMSQGILGYWIAQRWGGLGITSLAVATVMDMVLKDLGLHRLEVNVKPDNERSLRLCRNLGLREEGYKKRYMSIASKWADHVSFAIDQEDVRVRSVLERIRR